MARKAECGTFTAYKRHKRNGEPIDEACAQAARDQRGERRAAEREAAAAKAQVAAEGISEMSPRLDVLYELQRQLQAHMLEAPPQSIAGIAGQLRGVAAEIESLTGADKKTKQSSQDGGGVDELTRRRDERQARRIAATQS